MGGWSSKSAIGDPAAFVQSSIASAKASGSVLIFSKSYCPCCTSSKRSIATLNCPVTIIELDQLGEPRNGPVQQALKEITWVLSCPQVFGKDGEFMGDDGEVQRAFRNGSLEKRLGLL